MMDQLTWWSGQSIQQWWKYLVEQSQCSLSKNDQELVLVVLMYIELKLKQQHDIQNLKAHTITVVFHVR